MNNNKATSGTIEDAFPLSMLQQGMLFHSSLDEHLGVYHDVFSYEIETHWDEAKFSEMLDFVIARHGVLRTIYRMDGARPLQVVMKHKAPFLEIADLRNRDESERKEALTEWLAAEKRVAIDPAQNVWKAFVHVLSDTQIQFGLSFHHALWDGWSVANFVSELFAGYAALLDGKTTSSFSAEKPPSYRSFVALEQQALNSAENKAYWADKLLDAKTPWWTGEKSGQSQFFLCEVSKEQSEQVIATANELDVAEKSIWCAIYLSLVAVLNGSLDAIGSIATHGRPEIANSDKMLGLFLNTLPLRVNLKNMKWRELVKAVDEELREQYAYRHHPLVDIQNQTGLDFSASMFGYLNFRVYGDSGVKSQILGGQGFEETNYRMVISVEKLETSRRHVLRINADTSLFNERYQTHIRAYVNNIIDSVTTRKDQFINAGKLIGADERALQLAQSIQSKDVETGEQTLLTAFEQVRQQYPDAMAFISESEGLSYQQLDLQSNQLANYLRAEGVRQASVLAIVLSPSAEMLVSVLAVLKLACSYVLIDARKSTQSVSWIARKTGANLIIRNAASRALPALPEEVKQIFIDQCAYLDASVTAPETRVYPNAVAAITYTQAQEKQGLASGFSHASLLRFTQARAGKTSFQEQVKGLGDLSVQLWTHLLAGETLDLASMTSDVGNVSLSSTLLARSAVGEFYVLRQLDLVPIGSSGELFLGGDTVADVIAASPQLSASKLIPHPFSGQAGKRLFATGLTAKLDIDGNLEILSQDPVQAETIRLAGLKKSEQVLRLHPGIRDVAMERDNRFGGPGKVVAYCVMDDNSKEMTVDVLTLLRNQAQPCVLPSVLTQVSSITRYPNGKVDFSQLPSPFAQSREDNFEAPVGACEELLANIWIDLLKCGRVGRNANFFELGGYSLIGAQLVARIRNVFGIELPLRDVFERKDLKSQALLIEQAQLQGSALPALEVVDRSQPLPLSFSQQRLWFLSRMMPPNAVYNIPFALRLRGQVDESALVHSLNAIISRHEALRTRFADVDGQAVQLIDPPGRPCVVVEDIDSQTALDSRILAERHYCFDLSNEPLVRLRVLNTRFDGHHVLLATFHHIVADGWSMGVFFKELVELYRTTVAAPGAQITPLAPLRLQFADYAHWQRQQLTGNIIAAQLSYWEHQLAGLPPLLDLP
ncbi:condensation domain-containing protein, partial [Undibacterium sp. TJN19]|uniref:condensation domain-containing protein n=1 Tax=Undibacterium sp. TJN19 TaxID=3413055 RepID=UPI003BF32589